MWRGDWRGLARCREWGWERQEGEAPGEGERDQKSPSLHSTSLPPGISDPWVPQKPLPAPSTSHFPPNCADRLSPLQFWIKNEIYCEELLPALGWHNFKSDDGLIISNTEDAFYGSARNEDGAAKHPAALLWQWTYEPPARTVERFWAGHIIYLAGRQCSEDSPQRTWLSSKGGSILKWHSKFKSNFPSSSIQTCSFVLAPRKEQHLLNRVGEGVENRVIKMLCIYYFCFLFTWHSWGLFPWFFHHKSERFSITPQYWLTNPEPCMSFPFLINH